MMNKNEETKCDLTIAAFWLLVCSVADVLIWGKLLDCLSSRYESYWFALIILAILNACHYVWGLFHVDGDVTDVLPQKKSLLCSYSDHNRLWIRIIAILVIAPSIYLKQIVWIMKQNWKAKTELVNTNKVK